MALVRFELDHKGVAEMLGSAEMRDHMNSLGAQVAARVRSALPDRDARVTLRPYTTDRHAVGVAVLHRDALKWEAGNGPLTTAARSLGLEVTERRGGTDHN